MKNVLLLLLSFLLFFLSAINIANAQNDSINKIKADTVNTAIETGANVPDDEFNLFLLSFAVAFFCGIVIASFIGAITAILIVIFLFLFISAGVLSTSFIVGFYKRSFAAGFKMLLIILGMISGIFTGGAGLWFCAKFFNLHFSTQNALLTGAAGGCVGGILMGLIIFKVLILIMTYFKNKLKLSV